MVVMILEKAPQSLRGELSRWLIEPKSGVFVGRVSALVREKLWEKVIGKIKDGSCVQIWRTNTEQGFDMRMIGNRSREIVDFEGVKLIRLLNKKTEK